MLHLLQKIIGRYKHLFITMDASADEYNRYARQEHIHDLELIFELVRSFRKSSESSCTDILFMIEQMAVLDLFNANNHRYTSDRHYRCRYDARDALVDAHVHDLSKESVMNEREFKNHYRMTRSSFLKLWHAIKDHPVFRSNKSTKKQASSKYQLLVLLKFLGTEGDGMSNHKAGAIFPSSYGSFDKMKDRVVYAIVDYLSDAYYWPDAMERKMISKEFQKEFYINQCVGVGDGTLLGLGMKPSREDFPDFNGRKGHYTITCFIFCDHLKRIRYYHSGWPGNVHDERVYRTTKIAKKPADHFSKGEYLLCDSAVAARDTVVPQFKKNFNETDLDEEKAQFNTICALPRVIVEHCIGLWKNRFPFLRNIRMRITDDPKTMTRIQRYIRVTVILHNLLIGYADGDVEDDDSNKPNMRKDPRNESLLVVPHDASTPDKRDNRRIELLNYLITRDAYLVVMSKKK